MTELENRTIIPLLILIIAIGTLLRFWSLGSQQLTSAELEFHYAAQSVAQGHAPVVPSGATMGRGGPIVRVIAGLQGVLREVETAARIPSAVLGTVAMLLFVGFAFLVAGPWAALVSAFLFAFYPEAIRQSRTAGLYSFQQLCGVMAMGAGWLATAKSGPNQLSASLGDLVRSWIWTAVTMLCLAMAGLAHLSAGTVVIGFGLWVLALAVAAVWLGGARVLLSNLAAQLVVVGILCGGAIFLLKPDILSVIAQKIAAQSADPRAESGNVLFYTQTFASQFGWVFTLLPLLILLNVARNAWLTLYLAFWFGVPLLAHTFIVNRKEERLLLMAAPALLLLASLAINEGRQILARAINTHARAWLPSYRSAVRTANQVTSFVAVFALCSLPALVLSIQISTGEGSAVPSKKEWGTLQRILHESPNSDSIPFGTMEPLVGMHYARRSDFTIGAALGDNPALSPVLLSRSNFRPALDSVRLEGRSGVVLATSITTIRNAYQPYGEVFVAVDSRDLVSNLIDRELHTALESNATELCRGRCGNLRLFRLRLEP